MCAHESIHTHLHCLSIYIEHYVFTPIPTRTVQPYSFHSGLPPFPYTEFLFLKVGDLALIILNTFTYCINQAHLCRTGAAHYQQPGRKCQAQPR